MKGESASDLPKVYRQGMIKHYQTESRCDYNNYLA